MKEYELTDEEIEEATCDSSKFSGVTWQYQSVGHEAQKKLLEWLEGNGLLPHLPFTGATPTKPCEMCQLLKDFGIS